MVERARGLIGQVCRWIPGKPIIFVTDGGYAALELLDWCVRVSHRRTRKHSSATLSFITRLRLDAALYRPAPKRTAETIPDRTTEWERKRREHGANLGGWG